ncbi:MAG: indolepyruvate ferredoxin oxidoreductase family protein, partial [Pseudomonadota bacterium]|nr:indolepyruvate ferredoxin oxidoreductase family protein [Pseudomonadota bacterium]
HVMAELAGRTTEGLTQMGGEGVPWIGMAPFAKSKHIFANLGDGTYFHSGSLAVRAAVAAKAPITYKILYNDAVAMTGGQPLDGTLTVPQLTQQLAAGGVERIVVVSERPEIYAGATGLAPGAGVEHRDELMRIEQDLAEYPDVSVIVYDQTCAAEKRRRRKKGLYPDPDKRIFINDRVCEACGDCSVQSNCIAVEPLPTPFGVKRAVNQSSCNKDYSCVKGFCPSFVEVEGGVPRKASTDLDLVALAAGLPPPEPAPLRATFNVLLTGVGGMGITTAAAVLAMAAHLDGLNAQTLDMTGLAQKGGPVTSHLRIAPRGHDINGPRTPVASLDLLLAGDLLTAVQPEPLTLLDRGRTRAVANTRVAPTAEFVLHQRLSFDPARLQKSLEAGVRGLQAEDFAGLAEKLLGDAIYANLMMIGIAWQRGLLPIGAAAIENAIRLNGAAVTANIQAFHAGRILAEDRSLLPIGKQETEERPMTLDERIAFLARELEAYQDEAYATRFLDTVARVRKADAAMAPKGGLALTRAAVEGLYRLMAYKDEYEVARLYVDTGFHEKLAAQFEGSLKPSVLLAPPLLARKDPTTGRPRKMRFGPWVFSAFRLLARLKGLRGTVLDPFGWTAERRMERRLIGEYEALLAELTASLTPARYGLAVEIARTADLMCGYGFIKEGNVAKAEARRDALLARFRAPETQHDAPEPFLEAAE